MAIKPNLELKIGIFAFIGLVILTLAVFSISEIHIFRPGYNIRVTFTFASGIDEGAAVRVAGVQVGEVSKIDLDYDKDKSEARITLSIWLDEEVRLPRDSSAYVNVLGLIGETYLEIIPGEDYTHLLNNEDTLVGRDPLSTETMMEAVHKVTDNLDTILGSVNDVLDDETRQALQETIHNFRDFSESLKVIAGRLKRGEGKLGAWLKPRKKRKPKSPKSKPSQPGQNF
jgi:phospholipid/cholesterol/gamma-HCH transport system substrate-binding protein